MSERCANERTEQQVAQYLHLDSWVFWTTVRREKETALVQTSFLHWWHATRNKNAEILVNSLGSNYLQSRVGKNGKLEGKTRASLFSFFFFFLLFAYLLLSNSFLSFFPPLLFPLSLSHIGSVTIITLWSRINEIPDWSTVPLAPLFTHLLACSLTHSLACRKVNCLMSNFAVFLFVLDHSASFHHANFTSPIFSTTYVTFPLVPLNFYGYFSFFNS